MQSDSEQLPPKPLKFSPDDLLPPVEPPNLAFIRQLVLIPLLIVSLIVCGWMLFSWLASSSIDPDEMLQEIRRNKESSWQRAVTLSSMLENPDPRYARLRRDPEFAQTLGEVLREERKEPMTDPKLHEQRLKVCYFLCRALGSLETVEALDPLLEAAETERSLAEVDVRLGALEGIALLASKIQPETIRNHERAMNVLLESSRASDENVAVDADKPNRKPHAEVRGAAAYALGIVGGDDALDRLAQMINDPYPAARYNAATGLARHGDSRAVAVLVEMVDPNNTTVAQDEKLESDRDAQRIAVLKNGIEASVQLASKSDDANMSAILKSLESGATDGFPAIASRGAQGGLQIQAREALNRIREQQ